MRPAAGTPRPSRSLALDPSFLEAAGGRVRPSGASGCVSEAVQPRASPPRRRRPSCKIDVPRVNCVILLALGTKSQGVLALH
eukprot:COSAG03_NODE_5754_length_1182_cov_1.416436_2_plen_81_part_01